MTFEESEILARSGIKITHTYFTPEEHLIIIGNKVVFEDGVSVFISEWMEGKEYLLEGWSVFNEIK